MKPIYLVSLLLVLFQCYTIYKDPNQPVTDWDAGQSQAESSVDAQPYYDPYSMVDNSMSMPYYSS